MKKIAFIISVLTLLSCSNDEAREIDNSIDINNFNYKIFNTSAPNSVINSTTFELNNNRILSYFGQNFQSNQTSNADYLYTNNKISEISSFRQNDLIKKANFIYDSEGNLIKYLIKNVNSSNISTYERSLFIYTSDTIFVEHRRSADGINYNINLFDAKIVLDNNNNRIYYEEFDYLNNNIKAIKTEYDSNNNPITEEYLSDYGLGLESTFVNTITYNNSINLLNIINENTFSRKTVMLLYHFQSNAINDINVKTICINNIESFNTTFENSLSFQFENTINSSEISIQNDYKSFIYGDILKHFSYEFVLN